MKTVTALEAYTPTFEIDDGFRLTAELTIEAVSNDVRRWHEFSLRGADMHLFGAFMCGVALLRARDLMPKGSRGSTKKNDIGFDAWKRTTFKDISEAALGNYMRFSENVFLQANDLGKKLSVGFLGTGYKNFVCPSNKADAGELLAVIGTAMDGKTMTEMYRSQKRIREALCSGGDTGVHTPRRTKAEVEQEAAEADAATSAEILNEIADAWLDDKRYLRLNDLDLQLVRERLIELESAISALANDRRLKRLPDNWRLTEIAR
jgi:hypothetical protein